MKLLQAVRDFNVDKCEKSKTFGNHAIVLLDDNGKVVLRITPEMVRSDNWSWQAEVIDPEFKQGIQDLMAAMAEDDEELPC